MARAIASEAKLLLLDEPLSNLDAKLRISMRAELKRLHQELGTTIVYVTHDQVEAMTMSTKIALFSGGKLVQVAPPLELYMNPVTLEAADFIGNPSINLIEAKAKVVRGTLTADSFLGSLTFPTEDLVENLPDGSFDCVLGLRPEQITVLNEPGNGAIPSAIYADQPAGSETLLSLTCGEEMLLAKQIGTAQYKINQKVYIRVEPEKHNVYDKTSGRLVKKAH